MQPYLDDGSLRVIGVVQEQHAARARLYAQWRQLDWPIYVDSLNLLDHRVVPIPMLLDASGIIRARPRSPDALAELMQQSFPVEAPPVGLKLPDATELRTQAEALDSARAWRDLGDACFLTGGLDAAVAAFEQASLRDPSDARARFRAGVALKRRSESEQAQPGDAQAAIDSWAQALQLVPNQYIWRRRVQQYGPRLNKPYNFYFWIDEARQAIRARGDAPVVLQVEPEGSEIATPQKAVQVVALDDPDPEGRVDRDASRVHIETLVTPARLRPGHAVRVRLTFEPGAAWWNNEAEGLCVAGTLPPGVELLELRALTAAPAAAETRERRLWELELRISPDQPAGPLEIPLYVLYDVCEDQQGVCLRLRQDVQLQLEIDAAAASIE